MDANCRFEFERRLGGVWLVTARGAHGSEVQPGFDQAFSVVQGASAVVVDVSSSRMDSTELGALLRHARHGRGGSPLLIVARPGSPGRRLLDLCGAGRLVRLFDTADDAIASVRLAVRPASSHTGSGVAGQH